jgi:hypothetical protein
VHSAVIDASVIWGAPHRHALHTGEGVAGDHRGGGGTERTRREGRWLQPRRARHLRLHGAVGARRR